MTAERNVYEILEEIRREIQELATKVENTYVLPRKPEAKYLVSHLDAIDTILKAVGENWERLLDHQTGV